MASDGVQTCPKCGALIVPQLARCRRCNAYLHGTAIEGWIFEHLLPASAARSPGTSVIVLLIILYYLMMVVLSFDGSPTSFFGFSSFSLLQLGATHGASLLRGQAWRYVTSIFAHHDLMHVAFNLWALTAAGPLVEEAFDKKKMLLIYLVSGISSMLVSFLWYTYALGQVATVSAGASGAVSGLIGAALFAARRMGPDGRMVAGAMTRWAIYMAIFGLVVPGINNAAHFGGFAVGSVLALITPLGIARSVAANRLLSVAMLGLLGAFVASTVLMLANLRGFPGVLPQDEQSRGIFGMVYHRGVSSAQSDQASIWKDCVSALEASSPDAARACELNVRANHIQPNAYRLLAEALAAEGQLEEAGKLRKIAARMGR